MSKTKNSQGRVFSLSAQFGRRYRVVLDECWKSELPEVRVPDRHWYEQIPCKGEETFICLYRENPTTLKLSTSRPKNARAIFEQIKGRPGVHGNFHFDGEAEIFFPPALLPIVAEMAGARKRRQLSEAHKESMARGRERAGLVRDEMGRLVHSQVHNMAQNEAISTQAGG